MDVATMQMLINDLKEKIEEFSKQSEQNRAAKERYKYHGENSLSETNNQQQANETEVDKRKINQDNPSNQHNEKFHATLERQFLIDNQSQQSNEHQIQNQFDVTIDEIPYETASIAIKRINGLLCFEQCDKESGKMIGLIDMKVNNNYISREIVKNEKLLELKKPICSDTTHGEIKISNDISFSVVDFLGNFDFVLGMDGLKKINGNIDFLSLKLTFKGKTENTVDACSKLDQKEKNLKDNVQTENIENDEFDGKKIDNMKIGMKDAVETIKNIEIVGRNVPSKIRIADKIKIMKKTIVKLKSEFKLKLSMLFKKLVRKKNILCNVAKDFKYFEPG